MDKDLYRETGTLFKQSPLSSPEGEGFAAKVRAVVADHARQLQGMMPQAKQAKGRFTQGMAGKKRTMLPGGVLVETWINPNGLVPTLKARVTYPKKTYSIVTTGLLENGFIYELTDSFIEVGGVPEQPIPVPVYIDNDINSRIGSRTLIQTPVAINNNIYDSKVWTGDVEAPATIPHWHSGLGVLFAQAIFGAGKDILSILPEGWDYDPRHITLIRLGHFNYWLIKTNRDGCYAAKALIDFANIDINLKEQASTTSYEAYILSSITGFFAPIQLLSTNDFDLMFHYDVVKELDLAEDVSNWGFQWTYQQTESLDAFTPKACLTLTHKTSNGAFPPSGLDPAIWKTETWVLAITFSEQGDPVAELTKIEESDQFIIGSWLTQFICNDNVLPSPGAFPPSILLSRSADIAAQNYTNGVNTFKTEMEAEANLVSWYNIDGDMEFITKKGYERYNYGWDRSGGGIVDVNGDSGTLAVVAIAGIRVEVKAYNAWVTMSGTDALFTFIGTYNGAEKIRTLLVSIGPPGLVTVSDVIRSQSNAVSLVVENGWWDWRLAVPIPWPTTYVNTTLFPRNNDNYELSQITVTESDILKYDYTYGGYYTALCRVHGEWNSSLPTGGSFEVPYIELSYDFCGLHGCLSYDSKYVVTDNPGYKIVELQSIPQGSTWTYRYKEEDTTYVITEGMPTIVGEDLTSDTMIMGWIGAV